MSIRMKSWPFVPAVLVVLLTSCTLHHKIEPSEKPLVVNLNVKIDHEIRVKIREQNEDILNLEEEYRKQQEAASKGEKKG